MPKNFITFRDLTKEEYLFLFDRTRTLKHERYRHRYQRDHLRGRPIAVLFSKPSTRTRVSFECAITELGGHAIIIHLGDSQWARGEPLSHSARVFSRYVSGIVIRHTKEEDLVELAKHASIPVVNALTDERHPCQVLADVFTIIERIDGNELGSQTVAWIGDGGNMANTWLEAAAVLGFGLNLACPPGYLPDEGIAKRAAADNPRVKFMGSPLEAVKGATVVTTDVFTSMGKEAERAKRLKDFKGYRVDSALMAKARPKALFLHCLPAHPGEEVTEEVLESPASVIFDEAENRLHAQKALLEYLIPAK
ncbi:MAG: ornithine carbamoyltransferase [Deltaproteobacteria bacterium]|jgi:ornithine carbamoyltransferase|nr:ornithine carbamoyltransferase [Deltaproteobacteria bacterium]